MELTLLKEMHGCGHVHHLTGGISGHPKCEGVVCVAAIVATTTGLCWNIGFQHSNFNASWRWQLLFDGVDLDKQRLVINGHYGLVIMQSRLGLLSIKWEHNNRSAWNEIWSLPLVRTAKTPGMLACFYHTLRGNTWMVLSLGTVRFSHPPLKGGLAPRLPSGNSGPVNFSWEFRTKPENVYEKLLATLQQQKSRARRID